MSFIRKLLHARCDGRYKRAAETIDHLTKECRAWTDQYRSYANRYGDLHARALRAIDKLSEANKQVLELRDELALSQRELVGLRHDLAAERAAKERLQAELAGQSKEPPHSHHDGCPACLAPKSDRFEEHEIVDGLLMRLRNPGLSSVASGTERVLRFNRSWAAWTKAGHVVHWWPDKPTAEQVNLLYARP